MRLNDESLEIVPFQHVAARPDVVKPWAVTIPDVNARERVRLALKRRLDDLGMTGREFGKRFSANKGKGHGDQWVSNLLNGKFALSLDELDEAAHGVKTTAAELIRDEDEQAEFLSPSERRFLHDLRSLPPAIRDHFLFLAEYLLGVAPEEVEHLIEYRRLSADGQARVNHWMHALRFSKEPVPGAADRVDLPAAMKQPSAPEPRTRGTRR